MRCRRWPSAGSRRGSPPIQLLVAGGVSGICLWVNDVMVNSVPASCRPASQRAVFRRFINRCVGLTWFMDIIAPGWLRLFSNAIGSARLRPEASLPSPGPRWIPRNVRGMCGRYYHCGDYRSGGGRRSLAACLGTQPACSRLAAESASAPLVVTVVRSFVQPARRAVVTSRTHPPPPP